MLPDKHRGVVTAALGAVAPLGFALGGSAALAAYGLTGMSAKVIDLVTSRAGDMRDAAERVEAQLRRTGYAPERLDQRADLENILPRGDGTLAQWRVPVAGRHDHPPLGDIGRYACARCYDRVYLELGCAPRSREPVRTDIGPVIHPEDAAAGKVLDLARHARPRDYAQVADLLQRWSPEELISLARRQDPALGDRACADIARDLDSRPNVAFTALGLLRPQEMPWLRQQFARWPRGTGRAQLSREPEHATPGRGIGRYHDPRRARRDERGEPEIGRTAP